MPAKPVFMSMESLRDYALERLNYNPATGTFIWRDGLYAGKVAGSIHVKGYRLKGRKYRAGRLAYLMCVGTWPPDHVNRVRADDRIVNLRPATNAENRANKGPVGVLPTPVSANPGPQIGIKGLKFRICAD